MYTVKARGIRKTKVYCETCASTNVRIYAECVWDYDKQQWVFAEFTEDGYDWCDDCDCETCIGERFEYEVPGDE